MGRQRCLQKRADIHAVQVEHHPRRKKEHNKGESHLPLLTPEKRNGPVVGRAHRSQYPPVIARLAVERQPVLVTELERIEYVEREDDVGACDHKLEDHDHDEHHGADEVHGLSSCEQYRIEGAVQDHRYCKGLDDVLGFEDAGFADFAQSEKIPDISACGEMKGHRHDEPYQYNGLAVVDGVKNVFNQGKSQSQHHRGNDRFHDAEIRVIAVDDVDEQECADFFQKSRSAKRVNYNPGVGEQRVDERRHENQKKGKSYAVQEGFEVFDVFRFECEISEVYKIKERNRQECYQNFMSKHS